ncbi:MAG: nucleotidyl transferase AbiEii/AbiGii toxin family protein [Candidatus Aminicenantes bacterium]|nr:nucleotidyl transferase AbiEii/AbiGii toxin family protein [Candidatus Aminicenantes bacterium]
MKTILCDLSGKIESSKIGALLELTKVANGLDLNFFIIGATARDIVMEHFYKIKAPRMTNDIDIAVYVAKWEEYNALTDSLLATGMFLKGDQKQRYIFKDTFLDIIPFGDISGRKNKISWPPEYETILTTVGFMDTYKNSITFRLNSEPVLDVKVSTIPGLAILKLLSWNEAYPDRPRDAEDLLFIMRAYQNAGIEDRLYEQEVILLEEEEYDNERAGIRLLGRDMARISNADTANAVKKILALETGEDSQYRLISQMGGNIDNADSIMFILEKLKQGFSEGLSS